MHPLAALAFAPVLAAQGLYVRRTIPRLPEPPGPRAGRVGAGKPLRLLVIGDSAAAGVGAERQEEGLAARVAERLGERFEVEWECAARNGATSADALRTLAAMPAREVDVVVSVLGANDVTRAETTGGYARSQRALVALLRERFAAGRIALCGLPPMHLFPALPQPLRRFLGARARAFDAALRGVAAEAPDTFHFEIDIGTERDLVARDGFHPSARAYALWAEALAERLS